MPSRSHVCPVCELMIEPGQPVSFQHGELLHLACYETLARLKKPPARSPAPKDPPAGEQATAT